MGYKIQKNIFWVHIRVLWSSFPLHWKPNILLVNYDSWWQHQMSVRELRHDRLSGRFSKSRGLSALVSFLSSPPPPRSFTNAVFARSLTLVPRSLLLNRTETLATQANQGANHQSCRPETITSENQYACCDLSARNRRQKSHSLLSQNVDPSRA